MTIQRNDPCPCGSGRKYKRCCKDRPAEGAVDALAWTPRLVPAGPATAGPVLAPAETPRFLAWALRIRLEHIDPPIWRRVIVSPAATLQDLHELIQSFGWEDRHLWAFRDASTNTCLGALAVPGSDPPGLAGGRPSPNPRKVALLDCLQNIGDRILYQYDFGDGWSHEIELEGALEFPEPFKATVIGGENPLPLEDCGGPPGHARLQAFWKDGKDPHGSADYEAWAADYPRPQFSLQALKRRFPALSDANDTVLVQSAAPLPRVPKHRAQALTTDKIQDLLLRIRNVLAEFDRDHGMHSTYSSMSYTPDNGRVTVETSIIREDGVVMDREAATYLERAGEFGLSPDWLGKLILVGKDRCRVIGLKPRSKQCVLLESLPEPGKPQQHFKMHPEQLAAYFRAT